MSVIPQNDSISKWRWKSSRVPPVRAQRCLGFTAGPTEVEQNVKNEGKIGVTNQCKSPVTTLPCMGFNALIFQTEMQLIVNLPGSAGNCSKNNQTLNSHTRTGLLHIGTNRRCRQITNPGQSQSCSDNICWCNPEFKRLIITTVTKNTKMNRT